MTQAEPARRTWGNKVRYISLPGGELAQLLPDPMWTQCIVDSELYGFRRGKRRNVFGSAIVLDSNNLMSGDEKAFNNIETLLLRTGEIIKVRHSGGVGGSTYSRVEWTPPALVPAELVKKIYQRWFAGVGEHW